jgi:very-short-patch-repair endonuclease
MHHMDEQPRSRRLPRGDVEVVHHTRGLDRRVGRIAARQQGNVTRAQLTCTGMGRGAIARRIERGWLNPLHRGVYFVGHGEITRKSRVMAALLAIGAEAVVSHCSAARLYGFLPHPAQDHAVEITVTGRALRTRPGITIHRAPPLHHRDRRTLDNIPVTSPARTLLDVAASTPEELEAAFDQAVFQRAVRRPQLQELIERSAGRAGVRALRELVDAEAAGKRNRLEAEKQFNVLIKAARLPAPRPNAPVGRFTVDFLWAEHRVVAELDGFATHGKRGAFEGDRARDGDLQALDHRVLRITWRQLTREPYAVVARVAAILALSGRQLALG